VAEQKHPLETPAANETAAIKSEIARTRVEMSETLGELQDRLRPDHLLQQARDGVTNAATGKVRNIMQSAGQTASMVAERTRDAGSYLADYATAHPIRIAITVGALTWWMLRGRDRASVWDGAVDTRWDDEEPMASGLENRPLRERVGEYASSARETVGEYATSARETVGEYAATAGRSARRASASVRGAARSATTSVDGFARENPMAAGAIALAIGAAIGLSAPRTAWEDSAMGETRDRAWEKASTAASSIKETVVQKASTAAENLIGEGLAKAATTAPSTPSDPIGRV
jgi:ElaB/YqjD/DUF883 family membrane-anchored ribosome-binding protein